MKQWNSILRLTLLVVAMVFVTPSMQAQRFSWVTPAIGLSFDEAWAMGLAPNGDLHIVGTFLDSLDFGEDNVFAFGTNYDVFTARYSSTGKNLTSSNHGSSNADDAQSLVVDNKGNYYFAGSFGDVAIVQGERIETIDPASDDMFVAKVDKNGALVWVKVFGSPTYDEGAPFLAVDSVGNVYITGGVGGKGQFGTKTYQSVGKLDFFVAKMSAVGDFIWVQGAGSTDRDQGQAISVSSNGDRIYASGTFIGLVSFGNTSIESFAGKADFFVNAFNANGTSLWVKRIGYSGDDKIISSATTADGKLLLAGAMSQVTTFDTKTLKANGEFAPDFFVCRMTKDGAIELLKNYGGTFDDVALCIVAGAKGAMFVGGYYDSTTTIAGFVEQSVGGRDGFVSRILQNGDVDWYRSYGGPYDDETRGVVVDQKNIPYICGVYDTYAYFDDIKIDGGRFTDVFIAALDCGPSTLLNPLSSELNICEGQDSLISARFGYPKYEWFLDGQKQAGITGYSYVTGKLVKGTHKVFCQVTGFDDCIKNTDTVTIVVRQGLPVPTITRQANFLQCSVDNMMYQWYREGNEIAGATNQTVTIQGDGNYRVVISDTSGCDRWSTNFLVGATDVFENESGTIVTVYPNPTQGELTIAGAAGADVTITDMLGRTVVRLQNIADVQILQLDGTTGTYSVTLRSGNSIKTMLITKQ